jgi:hypothetical protein
VNCSETKGFDCDGRVLPRLAEIPQGSATFWSIAGRGRNIVHVLSKEFAPPDFMKEFVEALCEPLCTVCSRGNPPHLDGVAISFWLLTILLGCRGLLGRDKWRHVELKRKAETHSLGELGTDEVLPVGTVHVNVRSSDPPNVFEKFGPEGVNFKCEDRPFAVIHVNPMLQGRNVALLEADTAAYRKDMTSGLRSWRGARWRFARRSLLLLGRLGRLGSWLSCIPLKILRVNVSRGFLRRPPCSDGILRSSSTF